MSNLLKSSKSNVHIHYPLIDYYRFLAALIVCISHFLLSSTNYDIFEFSSILGVELFFVLSGFVLTPQLLLIETNPIKNIKIFLIRRWIRTLPPYVLALVCAYIIFGNDNIFTFFRFLTYTQNIFGDNIINNFYPVAWSLSVEEWFYIYIPALIFCAYKLNVYKKINISNICIITIVLETIVRFLFANEVSDWGQNVRRSVIFRIDAMCWGVLAYIWKDKINLTLLCLSLLICTFLLICLSINSEYLVKNNSVQNLFFPVCSVGFSSLLILLAQIKNVSKKIQILGSIGANISYSMYLFHIFFIVLFQKTFERVDLSFIVYFVCLTTFCMIFFISFERPIMKLRPKYVK
jgi:peptidoglycan/LPS O-acetylase OafA/YrhL